MRTLVTGGAGFIGTHLVRALVERGDEVVVLDSLEPQVHGDTQPDLPAGVELIVGNVGDRDARRCAPSRAPSASSTSPPPSASGSRCTRSPATPSSTRWRPRASSSTSWPSARCPSAWWSPRRCRSTARASTCARSTAASRRARAPRSSCSPARGRRPARPAGASSSRSARSEAKPLIPTSIYAINKRDHEEMVLVTGAAYGIPAVALRFFNVYGPGQALSNPYTGVAAIFASRLLNGRPPIIFEDGEQSRDFTHVSDIVAGHPARARVRQRGRATRSTSAPAARPRSRRSPRSSRPAWASTSSPSPQPAVPRRRHPPLLRRPDPGARAARLRGRHDASRTA